MNWIALPLVNLLFLLVFWRIEKTLNTLENLVVFFTTAILAQLFLLIGIVDLQWQQMVENKHMDMLLVLDTVVVFPISVVVWLNKMRWAPRRLKWLYVLGMLVTTELIGDIERWVGVYEWKNLKVRLFYDLMLLFVLAGSYTVWRLYNRYALRRGVRT